MGDYPLCLRVPTRHRSASQQNRKERAKPMPPLNPLTSRGFGHRPDADPAGRPGTILIGMMKERARA